MFGIVALIGSLTLILAILSAFLITQLPRKMWIKFLLIPIVLALACTISLNITELMGYPYNGVPKGQFAVEDARVSGTGGETGTNSMKIEFWAVQHGQSRLYSIPFNAEVFQKLQQALAVGRSGKGEMTLQFQPNGGLNSNGEAFAYSLEGHFTPLVDALPKKSEPSQQVSPPEPSSQTQQADRIPSR